MLEVGSWMLEVGLSVLIFDVKSKKLSHFEPNLQHPTSNLQR